MSEALEVRLVLHAEHPSAGEARTYRATFSNGRHAHVHVATYERAATRLEISRVVPARPVMRWCADTGTQEALNGGFFTKPEREPLGMVRIDGDHHPDATPFQSPWDERRGAIQVDDAELRIAPYAELRDLPGDLLQASPILVRGGEIVVADEDPEGLSTTQDEFDSDITAEPLPRTAIGFDATRLFAVSVDGRSDADDGVTLPEFAVLLRELGVTDALNVDGGSSSGLITAGEMRNHPRDDEGELLAQGYPTPTAFAFVPR
ncbi:MAG: hypothetical protein JWM25_463 [Thermoleophilia bacterium]|nr:hypothetical protein [Thermoleophilia bacterium]MCZ4495880.1 hypothetical protein [Thermoleophilia bacterium]